MDRETIIEKYRDHVLEHGSEPVSVFRFARDLGMEESDFFRHFASFEVVEAAIWKDLVAHTIAAVESGGEWQGFTAHQRLLTFYYAFFEAALAHRSFFLSRFPRCESLRKPPTVLRRMKEEFVRFAGKIVADGIENHEIACRGKLNSLYPQALFGHFLSAIEFNLRDDSEGFERTDAYLEKSVRLAFDIAATGVVESAFDLVRFLSGRSRNQE